MASYAFVSYAHRTRGEELTNVRIGLMLFLAALDMTVGFGILNTGKPTDLIPQDCRYRLAADSRGARRLAIRILLGWNGESLQPSCDNLTDADVPSHIHWQ